MLEWNVDTRTSSGMGSQAEDIKYADIAVRDLRQADGILQRQPLMTCEPHVRWPFTPLRRGQAVEHHEGDIRAPLSEPLQQIQPQLKLIRLGRAVLPFPQSDRDDAAHRPSQLEKIIGALAAIGKQLDSAERAACLDLIDNVAGDLTKISCRLADGRPLFFPGDRDVAQALEHKGN